PQVSPRGEGVLRRLRRALAPTTGAVRVPITHSPGRVRVHVPARRSVRVAPARRVKRVAGGWDISARDGDDRLGLECRGRGGGPEACFQVVVEKGGREGREGADQDRERGADKDRADGRRGPEDGDMDAGRDGGDQPG